MLRLRYESNLYNLKALVIREGFERSQIMKVIMCGVSEGDAIEQWHNYLLSTGFEVLNIEIDNI